MQLPKCSAANFRKLVVGETTLFQLPPGTNPPGAATCIAHRLDIGITVHRVTITTCLLNVTQAIAVTKVHDDA